MNATRWWWLVGAIVVAPACRGTVEAERQAGDSTGSPAGSSAGGGGGGGSSSAGSTSSSSGSGAGGSYGDDWGPSFCTYTLSGAMEVTGTDTWPSYYGSLDCAANMDGGYGYFSVDLHLVTGPGSYPLVGPAVFDLQVCSMDGQDCTDQRFDAPAWGCGAEITVAPPAVPAFGERFAGTVWCAGLVSETDPTQILAVTSGFSFVMPPPPCRAPSAWAEAVTPAAPQ